jgi:transcriptional regulator with XRE-family HTH domain
VEISTAQVRAARALLDWTQADLAAAAKISLPTVKRYEAGSRTPIPVIISAIFLAFEEAGIIFETDAKHVGVKLKIKRGK